MLPLPDPKHRPVSECLDALVALDGENKGEWWVWALDFKSAVEADVAERIEAALERITDDAEDRFIAEVVDHCGAHFDETPASVEGLCARISAAFTRGSEVRAEQERELNELRKWVQDVAREREHLLTALQSIRTCALDALDEELAANPGDC